jgi:hypothetical protein
MSEASEWIVVPAHREFLSALLFGPVKSQSCGVCTGGNSARTDPELHRWLRWASEGATRRHFAHELDRGHNRAIQPLLHATGAFPSSEHSFTSVTLRQPNSASRWSARTLA